MTRLALVFMIIGVLAGFFQLRLDVTLAFATGLVVGAFCHAWAAATS